MLKRVKIQGYKSLADVEVNLQPLSVFFGSNASGKSNFLDALQLLSRIATSNTINDAFKYPHRGRPLEAFTFGPGGIQDLLAKEKVSFTIEVDVELSQKVIDDVNRQFALVDQGSSAKSIHEKYLRYVIEIESFPKTGDLRVASEKLSSLTASSEPKNPLVEISNSKMLPKILLEGLQLNPPILDLSRGTTSAFSIPTYLAYSPHLSAIRQELINWSFYYLEPRERMRLPDPVREVRRIGQMGEELAAYLNTLQAQDKRQFKALEKALNMIIPSITGIDVGVNNSGDVELSVLEGSTPISVRVLSEGTLRILGMLAISGAKDQPSLLCLEEPENGVTPRRIRQIVSLLETRAYVGTQVIATTHSPILIDLIPHESLYVCRKRGGHTSIEPFSLWEYPDDTGKDLVDEEEDLPELTVSERSMRGDFDVEG